MSSSDSSQRPGKLDLIQHPLPVRAINGAGAALRLVGLDVGNLRRQSLLDAAVREAGCDDFGEPDFEEPLAVLLESVERDAKLTLIGRVGFRELLVGALATRLLRQQLKKTRPEIFERELTPLIVIGLPRSGTTLLHRLLAQAPEARSLRYFEVRKPIAGPGPDRRLAWARRQYKGMALLAPGLDAKHFSGPEEPEECLFLFDSTLVSSTFWIGGPVYGYLDWYLQQDQHAPYRAYREHLQIFQNETPAQRLTLKAPIHTAHLAALLAALPRAKLVQLHRDPVASVNSVNSLFYTLHRAVTDEVDLARLGRTNLEFLAQGIDRLLAARSKHDGHIVDVDYRDLLADPLGTVRRIHEEHELPLSPEHERRVREFARDNPQHKHGAHRYCAEDFSLTDAEIAARFRHYVERFPAVRSHDGR